MSEQPAWYREAADELLGVLARKPYVDGFDFLFGYLGDTTPEGLQPPTDDYGREEVHRAAREHLDKFESWLAENCGGQVEVRDRHTWARRVSQQLAPAEIEKRSEKAAELLSIRGPARRTVQLYTLNRDELIGLDEARADQQGWGMALSGSVGAAISAALSHFSSSATSTNRLVAYLGVFAGGVSVVSLIAWRRAWGRAGGLRKKIEDELREAGEE